MIISTKNIDEVVILDPGLREFGGHHPGIIEGLQSSPVIRDNKLSISVYASKDCSAKVLNRFSNSNIKITPNFETDFYLNFYSQAKLSTFNVYVHYLAKEYLQVFHLYKERIVTFFYHTLNWEHAYALSLAINLMQKQYDVDHKHLVCLMFNPSSSLVQEKGLPDRYFKFNTGFKALSKIPKVELFSAEQELTENYRVMLGNIINLHPCGLITQQHRQDIAVYKKEHCSILLYLGDAKENKGFLKLPGLVKKLAETIFTIDVKFIIQYTITNSKTDLAEVDRILKQWSVKDNRIEIQDCFLTDQEMHSLWLRTTHTVFNYNEIVYGQQSSGVLWQAAAYKTTIYLMTNSWLNREAERLGCTYSYVETVEQLQVELQHSIANFPQKQEYSVHKKNEYRDNLFSDLALWLHKQVKFK